MSFKKGLHVDSTCRLTWGTTVAPFKFSEWFAPFMKNKNSFYNPFSMDE